jgi:hypothetical protein
MVAQQSRLVLFLGPPKSATVAPRWRNAPPYTIKMTSRSTKIRWMPSPQLQTGQRRPLIMNHEDGIGNGLKVLDVVPYTRTIDAEVNNWFPHYNRGRLLACLLCCCIANMTEVQWWYYMHHDWLTDWLNDSSPLPFVALFCFVLFCISQEREDAVSKLVDKSKNYGLDFILAYGGWDSSNTAHLLVGDSSHGRNPILS